MRSQVAVYTIPEGEHYFGLFPNLNCKRVCVCVCAVCGGVPEGAKIEGGIADLCNCTALDYRVLLACLPLFCNTEMATRRKCDPNAEPGTRVWCSV